jgi:hypothetical protein
MPVVTPFGQLTLGDRVALSKWAQAHAAKHQSLTAENIYAGQFAVKPGTYVVRGGTGGDLNEPIDGDWMLRHFAKHVSLATAAPKSPTAKTPPLALSDLAGLSLADIWQTEEELQDWHALHNRVHKLIDAQRAIATTQAKPNIGNPAYPHVPHMPGRPGGTRGPIP